MERIGNERNDQVVLCYLGVKGLVVCNIERNRVGVLDTLGKVLRLV
jgi:hypothetical protein